MQANLMMQAFTYAATQAGAAGSSALTPVSVAAGQSGAPFAGLMSEAIQNINTLEQQAATSVEGLMDGSGVDIHQAMIATQKADAAFELALAVRNKAVGAYQQLMAMQF